jgi:hypothetical protein
VLGQKQGGGDAQRALACERAHRSEEGRGQRALVGVHVGLADEQRGLERALPDRRQFRQDLRAASLRRSASPPNAKRVSASEGRQEMIR